MTTQQSRTFGAENLSTTRASRSVDLDGGGSAFLGVQVGYDDGRPVSAFGKIEFNPSRVVDPSGVGLASLDDTLEALTLAVVACGGFITPECESDEFRLKRLDVAKDFTGVEQPSALIRGLAPIPRRWARKNLVHADPSRKGAQTLLVGSNSGSTRLYDKHAETEGRVPQGTVRFEIEARSGWLERYGRMKRVKDLSSDKVEELAVDRWGWSSMGVEVGATAAAVAIVSRSDLSAREQAMFLGWLVMQSTEYAYQPAKATLAKFRKLQRDMGVAIEADRFGGVGFSSHLDWDSGTEVLRVAA